MQFETWALVAPTRPGIHLTTRVAGTALAVRHARLAQRQGWSRIRFLVNGDTEAENVRRLLSAPGANLSSIRWDVADSAWEESDNARVVHLDAAAVYTPESLAQSKASFSPPLRLEKQEDVRAAEAFLFASIRKSVELDGLLSYYVLRPLARVLTRTLVNTRISPNQVTLAALACGLLAAALAALGGAQNALWAGGLYWFGGILDHVDGDLARLRLQSSKVGEWLDCMVDEISTLSLLAGLGIGLSRDGFGDHWSILGVGASVLGALTLARLYYELHKQRLPIDTAQFPWFFLQPASNDARVRKQEPSWLTRFVSAVISAVGHIIRRDANLTLTALFLACNLRRIATAGIAIAIAGVTLLTVVHFAVTAQRR